MDIAYAMGAGQGAAGGAGAGIAGFLPIILIFIIFYFLLIRPQQKRAKDHKSMLDALQKGDSVVTAGGLYGKITGLTDTVVTLEIAEKVRVKVSRGQISTKRDLGEQSE